MKNPFILCILMLISVGCSTKMEDPAQTLRKFRGTFDEAETRTYLDNLIRLRWTAEDKITIFEGTTRNKQYVFLGETGDNSGDFEYVKAGFGTGNDIDRHYAVYPYASTTKLHEDGYVTYTFPSTQDYAEGSVGLGANPMVAVTADLDDYDLRFKNVGSYLCLKLYGAQQTVGSIVLTTNNGESIAGKSFITPHYGSTPDCKMQEAISSVTLNCSTGTSIGETQEDATAFWIVIPPVKMEGGLTVTVNGYYGGSQTYTVNSTLEFTRNKYKSMTRELSIPSSNGNNMGVNGWGSNGNDISGSAE